MSKNNPTAAAKGAQAAAAAAAAGTGTDQAAGTGTGTDQGAGAGTGTDQAAGTGTGADQAAGAGTGTDQAAGADKAVAPVPPKERTWDFEVVSRLDHDNKTYMPGEKVTLTEAQAKPLVGGAIKFPE